MMQEQVREECAIRLGQSKTRCSSRVSRILSAMAGVAVLWALLNLTACLGTEEAVLIDDPPADSVVFWPPTMKYARYGDTLYLTVRGLKHRKVCAVPLQVSWNFNRDSTGAETFQVRSSFEIPAGASCSNDAIGLDTLFRVRFYTRVAKKLYLKTPEGVATDSLLFIAGEARDLARADLLTHIPGSGDSTSSGRILFRDSTASHPRRMVHVDSLAACEILQTAVYEKRGDTTLVKVRMITAAPMAAENFPPCAGPHTDSVEVVFNKYNFLP